MKLVSAMVSQSFERTTLLCNALVARHARIINVNRPIGFTYGDGGPDQRKYEIWFEHEEADYEEWRDEIYRTVDSILNGDTAAQVMDTLEGEDKVRILEGHKDGGMDSKLKIEVLDEPGPGGACHQYRISEDTEGESVMPATIVKFQKGPVKENGLNGISQEVLLEIVRDRLESFQGGKFACEANQVALDSVNKAMTSLQERTKDRIDRSVEGTNEQ